MAAGEAVAAAIQAARADDRPSMIACKTVIGFGAPNKAGSKAAHGSPLGDKEIAGARAAGMRAVGFVGGSHLSGMRDDHAARLRSYEIVADAFGNLRS